MKQDWVKKQLRAEVIVGAFVLLVFLGIGYFTIVLTQQAWFSPKHAFEAVFQDVMGLRADDGVVVRGMTIGKIKTLELRPDGVHVVAALEQAVHLREGCVVKIVSTSILGGRYMEIKEGPEDGKPLPESAVPRGEPPNDLMGDAADLVAELKKSLIAGGTMENLRVTMERVRTIAERLEAGEGTIGKLLSKDDSVYTNLAATVANLNRISTRLEAGEGTLGKLMSEDTGLYTDLTNTVANLNRISTRLEAGEGTLGKLLSKDDQVYQDLASASHSLKTLGEKLESGNGVLPRLINDEKLGQAVAETITEVRQTVDDFRETSPVVTFTSIFFGAL